MFFKKNVLDLKYNRFDIGYLVVKLENERVPYLKWNFLAISTFCLNLALK